MVLEKKNLKEAWFMIAVVLGEQVACFVKMMDISFWSLYISDLPTLTWVCPVALYVLKWSEGDGKPRPYSHTRLTYYSGVALSHSVFLYSSPCTPLIMYKCHFLLHVHLIAASLWLYATG